MDFKITIRRAVPNDSTALTEISFASKRRWQYPEEYLQSWKSELTISADYISNNTVFAAESEKESIGYYSLVKVPEPFFVKYNKMHAEKDCILMGGDFIHVLSDPNATGFYLKAGYDYISDVPSSIENRKTPYLRRA